VIESALGIIGGIQFIPVLPDHEHYPDAPMTLRVSDDKSYAYVRIDEWPKIRAALLDEFSDDDVGGLRSARKVKASNPPAWFGEALTVAKHQDEIASWPWWARMGHRLFISRACPCCIAYEKWKKPNNLVSGDRLRASAAPEVRRGD